MTVGERGVGRVVPGRTGSRKHERGRPHRMGAGATKGSDRGSDESTGLESLRKGLVEKFVGEKKRV